ncbi:MAG: pyridoxal-phosphate dependent enzyme [Bryobacteraceae bacterium]
MPGTDITLAHIEEAAERIRPIAQKTPVMTSRSFNSASGVEGFFKCENFQTGGAFKIRGAANFIFSMAEADKPKGVVAFSSGNHAQAVSIASEYAGVKATIVMPDDAPKLKLAATKAHGAEVIIYDRFEGTSREAIGKKISAETGAILVPPFEHPKIIAGQGTAALELLEQAPDLDTLVVCVGGGGLLAGCAIAAKALRPGIRIFGVEPERASDVKQSFDRGELVEISQPDTIADGLRTPKAGATTFAVIQRLVEDILLVGEDEIRAAMKFLLLRMKILAEPSGAVGAAAVLAGKLPKDSKRVGIIISGGNVDPEMLAECIR